MQTRKTTRWSGSHRNSSSSQVIPRLRASRSSQHDSLLTRTFYAFAVWLIILVSVSRTHAASYYVAANGLDTNPGSEAQPWQTIQKAANVLAPGDTVYVRSGTYSKVTVNVSGSVTGAVTFCNYPGETPVIDATGVTPPAEDTALFLLANRSYVTIQGFELRNYKTTNTSLIPAGIFLSGSCQHVQIRNCHIHDIWNTGGNTSNSGNAFGIAVYGSSKTPATDIIIDGNNVHDLKTGASESVVINGNVTYAQVTNNTVHDNNNIGIDFIGFEGTVSDTAQDQARDGVCRGNQVWNITSEGNQAYTSGDYSADGIYCDGATRITIERNIVHDTDIGVELASEHSGKLTSAITLRDNFIYANRQTGLFLGGYASSGTGGTDGCTITGNTFYENDTLQWDNGEAQLRYRTSNSVLRNNIFYSGPGNWLVSMPVSSANNINNTLDYNLYYSGAGVSAASWSWNKTKRTGFTTWKSASAQDTDSLFVDPKFVNTSATPDLHLRLDSPAIDTGDPGFAAATGEKDIDGGSQVTGTRVDIGADELTPIDSWRHTKFGANATNTAMTAATATPAGDGITNLLKYALAMDPLKVSTLGLPMPQVQTVNGKRYLTLQFTHAASASDVTCTVQVSGKADTWNDGSHYGAGGDLSTNSFTTEVSRTSVNDIETIVVRDNIQADATPHRFMRLKVTQP